MKTSSILMEFAGLPLDALPKEIQKRVEEDPALKAELERQAEVAGLLQLKTYERPADAMFGRVRHRTRIRLENQVPPREEPLMDRMPAWARMVAVVAVMAAVSVLTHREMLRAPVDADPTLAVPAEAAPTEAPEFQQWFHSDPFTTYVLNPSPGSVGSGFGGLTRQLEADFEAMGLEETNRFEEVSLLPVRLPASP